MQGCSQYSGPELKNVRISLSENFITSEEKLIAAKYKAGSGCRCSQCEGLKKLEDKWITRLGTYHGETRLNDRDEISKRARVTV